MSKLSNWLLKTGVPRAALDAIQAMVDSFTGEAKKRVQEIIARIRGELTLLLPTAEELRDSIERQAMFKRAYQALTAEQKAGVDAALLVICACAVVKFRKAVGL